MNGCGVVIAADAVPVYPAAVLRLAKRRVKAFYMMRFVWGLKSVIVHSSRGQTPIRLNSSLTADARSLSSVVNFHGANAGGVLAAVDAQGC